MWNKTIAADGGELLKGTASMAGPEYSQWLACRVDWQQSNSESGVDIFLCYSTWRVQSGGLLRRCWIHSTRVQQYPQQLALLALASVKTAAAGGHSGMLNMSSQASSLSTAAEPKCNSRFFLSGVRPGCSVFRSLWRGSAAMLRTPASLYDAHSILQRLCVGREFRILD